jgi:hypothetical protein
VENLLVLVSAAAETTVSAPGGVGVGRNCPTMRSRQLAHIRSARSAPSGAPSYRAAVIRPTSHQRGFPRHQRGSGRLIPDLPLCTSLGSAAARRTRFSLPGENRCIEEALGRAVRIIRTLAALTGFLGAKLGANSARHEATPGDTEPES